MNDLLVRACELVMMRHGVPEADLENSYGLAMTVTEHTDNQSGVAYALEVAVMECGGQPLEGTYDDAEFLINLTKALH